MKKISILRTFIVLIFVSVLTEACAPKNALIVGRLPRGIKCILMMPFPAKGDLRRGEETFLSEFLASDLFKNGVTGLVYPTAIRKAYESVKAKFPEESNRKYAADLGKAVGSDAALWGDITYRTIVEEMKGVKQNVRLITVEGYLVDSKSGDVNWYYDAKKVAFGEDYMKVFSEISSEMSWGLLRESGRSRDDFIGICPTEGLEKKVLNFIASRRKLAAKALPKKVTKKLPTMVLPEKPRIKLNDKEREVYNSLMRGEQIVLSELKFSGRTPNISKEGILFLRSLGKVLKMMGRSYKFRFRAHVDATENKSGDMRLSLSRAINIKSFLAKYVGLSKGIIEIKALGGQVPLLPNINRRSREKNRRVELSAVKISR